MKNSTTVCIKQNRKESKTRNFFFAEQFLVLVLSFFAFHILQRVQAIQMSYFIMIIPFIFCFNFSMDSTE